MKNTKVITIAIRKTYKTYVIMDMWLVNLQHIINKIF